MFEALLEFLGRIAKAVAGFFYKYYVYPLYAGTGYNPVNTVTYAILFALAVYAGYKASEGKVGLWKRYVIDVDWRFIVASVPFVVLGAALRVVNDAFFNSVLLMSPLLWVWVGLFYALTVPLCYELGSLLKVRWELVWGLVGLVAAIFPLTTLSFYVRNVEGALMILGLSGLWLAGLLAARKVLGSRFLSGENVTVIGVHMFDASATFIAVAYFGYIEQHFAPRALISFFGPWILFPFKFAVITLCLWLIDQSVPKGREKLGRVLKLALLILGAATGTRDTLRVALLV